MKNNNTHYSKISDCKSGTKFICLCMLFNVHISSLHFHTFSPLNVSTCLCLVCVCVPGEPKRVEPDLFKVFYNFWKEMEGQAQDVDLPSEVIDHLDNSECVYKLSSCIKTSHGVGKIAMTQKRLFLLSVGRLGFLEIAKFRDIEVKGL